MHRNFGSLFACVCLLTACGGGDDSSSDTSSTGPATTMPADDGNDDAVTLDDGGPSTSGDDTTGGGGSTTDAATTTTGGSDTMADGSTGSLGDPPTFDSIAWTQAPGCTPGVGSDVTISLTVSDPDDDVASLVISGSALGCTGEINAAESVISCPQAAPYAASVTVTDPATNSETVEFTIEVCTDGSVG